MPALGAFSLAGRVKDADGGWSLGGLSARIGKSDINGQASVTLDGPRPRITASLTSERLILGPLLGAGAPGEEAGPPADSGDGRIFPDDPLALDALGIVDAALSLVVKTAVLGDFTLEDTAIEARIENGRLTVKPLKLGLGGATLSGQALIDGRGKSARVEARIGARGLEVAKLLAGTAVGDLIDGKLDVDIEVKGRGRSVRALMAGLGGHVSAVMGEGRLASRYAEYVAADLLGALLPGGSSGEAEINCAITRFDIAKGQATATALLFDTGRITVGGDGSIDLAEEKLDLKIVPRPKNPSLLSLATSVRVRGTLASPSFGPDEAAVVKGVAGAVIGGAINPLGLLVPLVSAGGSDKNPCIAALEAARAGPSTSPARPSAQPSAPPAATPRPEEKKQPGGLFRALGGLGRTLDKALGQEKR